MFVNDYVLNGRGHGPIGSRLASISYEPGLLRPFYDSRNRECVAVQNGVNKDGTPRYRKMLAAALRANGYPIPTTNATSLRKEEWIAMDEVVVKAARQRLRAWTDLAGAANFGGFNGMTKMVLEHETMSDPGEAKVDFDGLSEGRTDAPLFQLQGLPLPITHSDFFFGSRRLSISRAGGTPLDLVQAEAAGRRVAEMIEQTVIGTVSGLSLGSAAAGTAGIPYGQLAQVYGYINFPSRLTKTDLNAPTGSNPEATVQDVLEMRSQLFDAKFYGPYMIYHSTDWDQYLDNDYARLGGNNASMTLRDRLRAIEGIQDVRRLDFLTPAASHAFTMVMVQMTSEVCRAVTGMELTTVQWETKGGMQQNFKVMAIMVPQLRADYYGNCGILHARTA